MFILNKLEIIKEFDEVVAGKRKFDLRVWRWVNYLRWYALVCHEKSTVSSTANKEI